MAKRSAYQSYVSAIEQPARLLWRGDIMPGEFQIMIESAVLYGMRLAFEEAGNRLGIAPNEFTPAEINRLQIEVFTVLGAIPNLTAYLLGRTREKGYRFADSMPRLVMWFNQYYRTINIGLSVIGQDPKLEWVLGPTEKHCPSCAGYAGKVKRQSTWQAMGVYPGGAMLACRGYNCKCQFVPTNKPMSRGPLPRLI